MNIPLVRRLGGRRELELLPPVPPPRHLFAFLITVGVNTIIFSALLVKCADQTLFSSIYTFVSKVFGRFGPHIAQTLLIL